MHVLKWQAGILITGIKEEWMQMSQVLGKNKRITPCALSVITHYLQQIDIRMNSKADESY